MGELEETGCEEGRQAFEQGREPIRMSNTVHDVAARLQFDRLRGESMRLGEPVEVWVPSEEEWIGGYEFVGVEERAAFFMLRHGSGPLEGTQVRYEARWVRRPVAAKE